MKKNCLCCGKTTSHLDLPIDLVAEQILCRDCAGNIAHDINMFYEKMPKNDFIQLKTKIITECKNRFNQDMIEVISATIDSKYGNATDETYFSTNIDKLQKNNTNSSNFTTNINNLQENSRSNINYITGKGSSNMFSNIGGKIKTLAQALCWIGIIGSVISGFAMMGSGEDLALLGFVVIVIGSLLSWVSSFTLYGFGQLIENTDKLVLNAEKLCDDKNKTDQ